ncbi:diaminobutyrate--2-oxoglutarate transaminase [Methyloprofundus sedimenti]|uniref:Diaminobutyrate--2-oxoglutarate transaminase n=1 Tax=Methyloprofundus sedimenti TaxID=1420851 RepID=A0A1V8M4J1_9GAMM|nr:aspartate aminotransferase family protein [Methyloprofundus sedimenti]OQK16438.1 diaminobutyrate--2-oxoglutarate transaminase [Methyloprofundus sedimenti]
MNIFQQRESEIRGYCRVYPAIFDTAFNARQTDVEGNQYIDFFAGAGVLNFGHNNERMKQAMIQYLERNGVTHSLDMHSVAKQDFMQRFVKTILEPRNMPHKMQFMGPTGTNAVEAALKLARRATGRQQIVAFSHGFHGMTLGALACTSNEAFRGAAGVPLNHVAHYPFGCETPCKGCELGCGLASLKQLRASFLDSSSGIRPPAAFMVEVIQAEGGVKIADITWLQELQALARELGALFIIDDIQVGCGRTGSYFSFDGMDLDPDIICLAKGVGGMGTPLALNLVKPEIDKYWKPGEHTGTFRGQGLSFVAGAEAMSYFEDDELMSQVHKNGITMLNAIAPLELQFPHIQIRGTGMIYGIDVASGEHAKEIVSECFNAGLLVSACGTGGRVIKLIPPLTIPEQDLQEGLAILLEKTTQVIGGAA